MSNETLLYVCGIILAVSAVTVSLVGLKVRSFPGKAMPLVVLWFAIFVVGSTTFAVLHAKDEAADKAKEAKYEKAGKEFEEEGGHVAPLGTEGAEGNEEAGEEEVEEGSEGEGHSEEGAEEAGAEESPESAEEGAEEGESKGAGKEAAPGKEAASGKEAAGGEEAAGGDPEAGATVFAENCSVCHGEDGHGGAGGPDLRTMPKAQSEEGAIEQVTDGGGGMPPFGGVLNEEEIKNVAAFVVQKVVGEG